MSSQSAAERLAALSERERAKFIAGLTDKEAEELLHDWRGFLARPDQIAPDSEWDIWCILAGRGWGKTRTGAEWIREQVEAGVKRIALIGETQKDLEEVMIEGDSGILSVFPPHQMPDYRKKPVRLTFHTGAIALGYNATQPDQLRGPQFEVAWSDEVAKWRYARETWDQLQFGLRLGDSPKQIVTTTPRPIELVKSIVSGGEGRVALTRGRTLDNRSNLSARFLEKIEERYAGTRLGRQELEGEILGDLPGALWRMDNIDPYRVREAPQMERIVVAVDHAVTNGEESNEHGVVAAGVSDRRGFLLRDESLSGTPGQWARRAIALYHELDADAIVVEVNQGGDLVRNTLLSVQPNLNIIEVRASRGKHVRAEPVASLYEQGRISHVGSFPELESQMCQMTTAGYEGDGSPDRLDAAVWAFTELFGLIARQSGREIPDIQMDWVA